MIADFRLEVERLEVEEVLAHTRDHLVSESTLADDWPQCERDDVECASRERERAASSLAAAAVADDNADDKVLSCDTLRM